MLTQSVESPDPRQLGPHPISRSRLGCTSVLQCSLVRSWHLACARHPKPWAYHTACSPALLGVCPRPHPCHPHTPWQNSVAKLKEIQPFVHSMLFFLVTWIGITPFLRSKLLPSNWRHCYQLLKSDWSKSTKLGKQQKKKQKQKYTNRPKIKLALHRSCLKSHIRHITNGSLCVQVLAKTTNRKGRCSMSQSPPSTIESFSNKNYLDEPQDREFTRTIIPCNQRTQGI